MNITRPLMLSFRFMTGVNRRKPSRYIIGAVLGIAIALIPLVVVLEVTGGMISGITDRYLEIGTYHLQIRSYSDFTSEEENSVMAAVRAVPEVKTVFPVITGVGLAYSEDGRTGVAVKGLDADYWNMDTGIHRYLEFRSGTFDLGSDDSVLISFEAARVLNVVVGDRIKLLTAKKISKNRTLMKPSYFTVKGIFSTGYYELDSSSVYINRIRAARLFNEPGSRFIGIKITDPYSAVNSTAFRISRLLPADWYVFTWYDLEKPMYENFSATQKLLMFIMLLIVVVASVNISSALVMMVMEKEKDVAILKSTGVPSSVVVSSYVYSGFVIGLAGTLIGIAAGLLLAVNVNPLLHGIENLLNIAVYLFDTVISPFREMSYRRIVLVSSAFYLDYIPVRINFSDVLLIGVSTVFLSTVAAIIPAVKAGRIKPLDVIRRQ